MKTASIVLVIVWYLEIATMGLLAVWEVAIIDAVPWWLRSYSVVVGLLGMALTLGIIYMLRKIVASLPDESPFTRTNARRMRWVALLVIGLGAGKRLFTWIY